MKGSSYLQAVIITQYASTHLRATLDVRDVLASYLPSKGADAVPLPTRRQVLRSRRQEQTIRPPSGASGPRPPPQDRARSDPAAKASPRTSRSTTIQLRRAHAARAFERPSHISRLYRPGAKQFCRRNVKRPDSAARQACAALQGRRDVLPVQVDASRGGMLAGAGKTRSLQSP